MSVINNIKIINKMKKIVFLCLGVFLTIITQSQGMFHFMDPDSLNLRHYESQYLLPEVMTNSSCQREGIILDIFDFGITSNDLMDNGYIFHGDGVADMEREYFPEEYNLLTDYAQPYYTDTTITVIGLSAYQLNWETRAAGFDSKYNFYLELRDSTLNNIIRSMDITSRSNPLYQTPTYTEDFFDTPVNINGKFYVVFHTPDTIVGNPRVSDFSSRSEIYCFLLTSYLCTPSDTSMYPIYKYANNNVMPDMNPNNEWTLLTLYNHTATMFYLFPILGEYNPDAEEWHGVGLNETRDISQFTHVFPNPTKQEVNINCGYKIKALQVFDEQGKRLFEKEINAYNYQINLENYPTGTYLIKVQTNSGQATKKVIKE